MGVSDEAVNKAGAFIKLHLILKADQLLRLAYTENLPQQREPECLAFAFFIALVLSVFRKRPRSALLFRVRHVRHLERFDIVIIPDRGI